MVFELAQKRFGVRVWYERSRGENFRNYYLFAISRLICAEGSLWKVVVGPVIIGLRFRPNLGQRKAIIATREE